MVLVKNKRKTPKQKDEEENDGDEAVEEELEGNENDLEDQFEAALHARTTNTWMNGGVKKDVVIRGLIQCFGSMIESFPSPDSIPDYRGRYRHEDMMHHKLLDASKQVVKAKRYENCSCSPFASNLNLLKGCYWRTKTLTPDSSLFSFRRKNG